MLISLCSREKPIRPSSVRPCPTRTPARSLLVSFSCSWFCRFFPQVRSISARLTVCAGSFKWVPQYAMTLSQNRSWSRRLMLILGCMSQTHRAFTSAASLHRLTNKVGANFFANTQMHLSNQRVLARLGSCFGYTFQTLWQVALWTALSIYQKLAIHSKKLMSWLQAIVLKL